SADVRRGEGWGNLGGRDGRGAVRRDRALLCRFELDLRERRRGRAVTIDTGVELRALSPHEVLAHRNEVSEIWPDASRSRIDEILPRHVSREGFRFFGAFADERLVGFVCGYRGARGQWWHDRVAAAL